MPITVFGAQAAVSMLNRAFNDISPAFAIYANQVRIAGTTPESIRELAVRFGEAFDSLSDSTLADKVLSNMGLLPNTNLFSSLVAYFAANPSARGVVVLQMGQILSEQESATGAMALYATAAVAWNNEVMDSHTFSINPATATYSGVGPILIDAKSPAESALADAIGANDKAAVSANTLVGAATLQAQAKTKADATDAVALAATGNTDAALAAAADDAALASATKVFTSALADAKVKVAYAKLAADTAVVRADAFVVVAASTLTTIVDDTAAAAVMAQAISQLEAANAVRAKVDAIASSVAPDHTVTLVGMAEYPLSDHQ